MKKITIGSKLPEFTLPDQDGKSLSIKELMVKKNLVIYFYPKDETPGCTKEACTFRDSYEVFKEYNAEVIGISADDQSSHKSFVENHKLPFILLSDENNEVRKLFGVPSDLLGLIPGRVTYIIDKEGVVRHVFKSQMNAARHVDEALEILKNLN
jgi:peroxiredoxin Q/BCP